MSVAFPYGRSSAHARRAPPAPSRSFAEPRPALAWLDGLRTNLAAIVTQAVEYAEHAQSSA